MTVVGVVKDVKEDLFNYRINRPVWCMRPMRRSKTIFQSISSSARAPIQNSVDRSGSRHYSQRRSRSADLKYHDDERESERCSGYRTFRRDFDGNARGHGIIARVHRALRRHGLIQWSHRTGEIGLRAALGAQPKHILGLIMGHGMKLTLSGVAIGLILAWSTTRLLVSLLFNLATTDAATFSAISLLLGLTGLLACYLPARAAMR